MPKFIKQVRNFLNNSPFKMYGKTPTPAKFNASLKKASASGKLNGSPKFKAAVDASPAKMYKKSAPLKETKSKGAYVKKGGKATGNMKDYAIGSKGRYNEYESRGWKQDDTTKGGAPKPETKPTAVTLDPVTVTGKAPTAEFSGPGVSSNRTGGTTFRAAAANARTKADTKADNKAKTNLEDKNTAGIATRQAADKRRFIAAKAKVAFEKKQGAAATQKQNMKDKIKLKDEIKAKRKSTTRKERKKEVKYQDKDTGKNVSAQDELKAKRKAKRQKGKAIRKYKKDPNNLKVAKVKKEKKSKVQKSVTSNQNSMMRE